MRPAAPRTEEEARLVVARAVALELYRTPTLFADPEAVSALASNAAAWALARAGAPEHEVERVFCPTANRLN